MSAALALPRMNVEEFLDWADAREDDGKYELDDGLVVAMAPANVKHARTKLAAVLALRNAVAKAGVPCETFMDGVGIRIDDRTSYLPDATLDCGPTLPGDVRFVAHPVIVVEVLSPSTAYRDLGRKARNYFRVRSILHYLIVDTDDRVVIHHRRTPDRGIVVTSLGTGELILDPPGLTVVVDDLLPPVENGAS